MPEQETNKTADAIITEKPDARALLAVANSASERVSKLHIAFMAVCAYVLVIAFGTTDIDLLMGKGVKLPIVNVDVPIIGFYAFAPYIVVLVHFNLLLQLQLLSRKLYAFDAAAPQQENTGGLRDQLHIFPYTYYLVGQPSFLVRALIGLIVSITVVLLPFATLLALQLQFLAYQNEVVTWWQRVAIWLDFAAVVALWPIMLDSQDDCRRYWRALLVAHVPRRRDWAVYVLLLLALVLLLFGRQELVAIIGLVLLLLTPLVMIPLCGWKKTPRARILYSIILGAVALIIVFAGLWLNLRILLLLGTLLIIPLSLLWHPQAPRGSLALFMTFFIGLLVPLALLVDGEGLERLVLWVQRSQSSTTKFSDTFLLDKRRLHLTQQLLMAKPAKPEVLALIRSGNWQEAVKQIEPINLQGRSLRHANMQNTLLITGDLRYADLQGANLDAADLRGANLEAANLQRANLTVANLQGADLTGANLQGAYLISANLQAANLMLANLQEGNLAWANLQGADLKGASLRRANLERANLQGANLEGAKLQGVDLTGADLRGAILVGMALYGVQVDQQLKAHLVDIRKVNWTPFTDNELSVMVSAFESNTMTEEQQRKFLERIKYASLPNATKIHLQSCLAPEDTPLICKKRFDPAKPDELHDFTRQLHAYLSKLSCESPEIARGIIRQVPQKHQLSKTDSTREGLGVKLKQLLNDKDKKCMGLQNLTVEEKSQLRDMK